MQKNSDRKKKYRLPKRLFSLPAVLLLAVFCVIVFQATYTLYKKSRMAAVSIENSKNDLATLQQRKRDLELQINHFKSEKGKEIEARKKFDIGRPGERMLIVVDPEPQSNVRPVSSVYWITHPFLWIKKNFLE